MTLCGSISAVLYSAWTLSGAGTKTAIHFGTEKSWYDAEFAAYPQVTVSDLAEPKGRHFKTNGTLLMHSYPRYVVNVWVPVEIGVLGTAETQLAEDMRYEVCRVILSNRDAIGNFKSIVPLDAGIARHELVGEPRMLRYEITLSGAHDQVQG